MQTDISEHSLPVYEALASKVRLQVIRLLSGKPMNVRELAQAVGLSSAIMTMHIKKLEKAGIVRTEMLPGRGGVQKKCFINIDNIEVVFPSRQIPARACHRSEVSVGHYTDFRVEPTCGLATPDHMIGAFDDPRYFLDPERVHAKILWFGKGFVEYKVPNFLLPSQQAEELEISMEIASEAPSTNNHWPSDITFFLNGTVLGTWTSPGDFGDSRGKYTPSWWPDVVNQYGLLKHLRITEKGTFMDGLRLSGVTIHDIHVGRKLWTFRIAVLDDAEHVGGVSLFGSGFGNYDQDIVFRLFYTKRTPTPED